MGILRSLFGPGQEEIWRQLSEQIGGEYSMLAVMSRYSTEEKQRHVKDEFNSEFLKEFERIVMKLEPADDPV